jgi:hypothetical protein
VKLKRRSSHGTRRGEKRKGAAASSANKEKLRRGILAELGKAPSATSPLSNRYAHQGSTILTVYLSRPEWKPRRTPVYVFIKVFSFSEVFVRVWLKKVPRWAIALSNIYAHQGLTNLTIYRICPDRNGSESLLRFTFIQKGFSEPFCENGYEN